jgi:1,2-diacylglycerol 3-alpha-glucosyltransferase
MKVLMLCEFYDESLNYQENILAKYYRKLLHEVIVVTSTFTNVFEFVNDRYDPTRPESRKTFHGVTVIRLPYRQNLLNRVRRFRGLQELFVQERPDLIFIHDIMLNMTDALPYLNANPSARMIMDYHADYSNSGKNWLSLKILHGIVRKRVLDRARPRLHRIFPVVPASAIFLREIYGVRNDEMELLPLGIDTDLALEVRASRSREQLRAGYGIAPDATVLVTGGKLAPAKKTELLLRAFAALPHPNLRLLVIGDAAPNDVDYCKQLHRLMADDPRIIATGWLNTRAVLEHLATADLAVFPASQSIMWQQAIGMGLPLVLGEPRAWPGGHQDVSYLNQHGNIVLLKPEDEPVQALGAAIQRLVDDRSLRNSMACGADRVAAEVLDCNRTVMQTLRFLESTQ